MKTRPGSSHPLLVAALLAALGCGGHRPPPYDVPPVLANREEITSLMGAVGAGLEAQVVLQMHVDEQGRVQGVKVIRESGVADLDDAALWIGEMMRFEPAQYEGRPVPAWVQIPVTFDVVTRVAGHPRLRNGPAVAAEIARDYPELTGVARFRVQVNADGWITAVRDRDPSDPEARNVARELVGRLAFVPAYRGGRDIAAWVNIVFEFDGPESRVYIETPET